MSQNMLGLPEEDQLELSKIELPEEELAILLELYPQLTDEEISKAKEFYRNLIIQAMDLLPNVRRYYRDEVINDKGVIIATTIKPNLEFNVGQGSQHLFGTLVNHADIVYFDKFPINSYVFAYFYAAFQAKKYLESYLDEDFGDNSKTYKEIVNEQIKQYLAYATKIEAE